MRVILGLDVSTKTIGLSIAKITDDENIKLLQVTHLRPKIPTKIVGINALLMKNDIFRQELKKYTEYGITDVVIEEPLLASNNRYTVATLLRYNGMISQSVYDILGLIPEFISSFDARKYGVPSLMSVQKYNKKGEIYPMDKIRKAIKHNEAVLFGNYMFDCAKKLILWNYVSEKYPDIQWVYDSKGNLKDENFDASDSLICILGYLGKEKYDETKPVISDFEENTVEVGEKDVTIFKYKVNFCGQTFDKQIEFEN